MVDMVTYQTLHPSDDAFQGHEYLSDKEMEEEKPPNGNFLFFLPATIHKFGFQDKKWRM
jgi:hypothetical protein